MGDNPYAIADILPDFELQKKWLERLIALPSFDKKSWRTWAEAVFDKMSEDENSILARSELKGKQTRDSSSEERPCSPLSRLNLGAPNPGRPERSPLPIDSDFQAGRSRVCVYGWNLEPPIAKKLPAADVTPRAAARDDPLLGAP